MVRVALFLVLAAAIAAGDELREKIERRIRTHVDDTGVVGLAVCIARGDDVLYEEGFGWADRDEGRRVDRDTHFRWHTVSGGLAAVLALQFAQEGKLELDADVRRHLRDLPEAWAKVSVRHLLCHQSGLIAPKASHPPTPDTGARASLTQYAAPRRRADPGNRTRVSDYGTLLVGALAEAVGGTRYPKLVRRRIAERMRMDTLAPIDARDADRGVARAYSGGGRPAASYKGAWNPVADHWRSTVSDLARFGIGLVGNDLLDADSCRTAWTRQKTADGKESGWGLGFQVAEKPTNRVRQVYLGSDQAVLLMQPDQRVVVAVMGNTIGTHARALARRLAPLVPTE